jgi:hypothetical protein
MSFDNAEAIRLAFKVMNEKVDEQQKRIVNLEQQVANQAVAMEKINVRVPVTGYPDVLVKGQAAQQQATQHHDLNASQFGQPCQQNQLYAPLRSDTKPLLEMAAFVRRIAEINPDNSAYSMYEKLRQLVAEAQRILKRST